MTISELDTWTDRPKNLLILFLLVFLIGGFFGYIDELASQKQMFYFCSLPFPADNLVKDPPNRGECVTMQIAG